MVLFTVTLFFRWIDCSAGNGAVVAGASLRPSVNRSSDVFMHCGCAELISESQLHNGMGIFRLFKEPGA